MKFEDFLMVKCMEQTHALDDDLPDVYEAWIVEQDVSDIIKWATEWHNYLLEDAKKYKVAVDVKFKGSTSDDIEKLVKGNTMNYKEAFDKMFGGTTPKDLDSVLPTRNCMFQYATNFGRWAGTTIHEDTGLLTEEEAIALWDKYKAQARKEVADGYDVDMVIWVDCESNTDYHTRHEVYNYEWADGGTL